MVLEMGDHYGKFTIPCPISPTLISSGRTFVHIPMQSFSPQLSSVFIDMDSKWNRKLLRGKELLNENNGKLSAPQPFRVVALEFQNRICSYL